MQIITESQEAIPVSSCTKQRNSKYYKVRRRQSNGVGVTMAMTSHLEGWPLSTVTSRLGVIVYSIYPGHFPQFGG